MALELDDMKRAITEYVRANDLCIFPEVMDSIPSASGPHGLLFGRPGVVFWIGVSEVAGRALAELRRDGLLFYIPEPMGLAYFAAGEGLSLPLVQNMRKLATGFATDHWLPVHLTVHHPRPSA